MSRRSILVTGANGELGQAIALAFLAESSENFVWLGVRSRDDRVRALAGEFPGRCKPLSLDVTRPEDWAAAVAEMERQSGGLHVLVNNAGLHQDGLLAQLPQDAWRSVIAVNLDSVFHGCRAVLPLMIAARSGRIVNIASLSAILAPGGQANYAAAKAGVVAMTQSLAKEVARLGITVNAVCPGYIETEALSSLSAEQKRSAMARIPMRRFGRGDEVAAAVRFLACSEASYITGSSLKIDGGIF